MRTKKRARAPVDGSESDDDARKKSRSLAKTNKDEGKGGKKKDEEGGGGKVPGGGERSNDGEEFWEISGKRRVKITSFSGRRAVDVREYYEKDEEWLPGKKGISLGLDQFKAFISFLPYIEKVLVDKYGEKDLPRPDYGLIEDDREKDKDAGTVAVEENDDDDDDNDKVQADTRRRRKNFEETSDEE